jgi:acetyl-CoA carboxylase biotin carboxyl carrier protein
MAKHEPDTDLIRKLAALLDETGLTEIEYATNALRVRVAKGQQGGTQLVMSSPLSAPAAAAPLTAIAAPAVADHPGAIISPMVGTAYVAGEPGAAPFVKVGDSVRQGQTILIIEAMKVMNPLTSSKSGTVTQVLVRDGQPVEYGEVLMVIESL